MMSFKICKSCNFKDRYNQQYSSLNFPKLLEELVLHGTLVKNTRNNRKDLFCKDAHDRNKDFK